ncbi:hypothetical protein ACYZT4_05455 [Pseudomonas sp. GB2N2]
MNLHKLWISGLLASLAVIQAGYSQAAGALYIWEGDNSHNCSIPTEPNADGSARNYLVKENGCTNDQAYTINFLGVDSALTITLFNDKSCQDNKNWEIEVLTVKQPTTTDPISRISISAMAGVPDGQLIAPGVQKKRYRSGTGIVGALSCVRVERK